MRPNFSKRHLLTHTEEKKYECEICHKLFVRKDSLQTHLKIHTGVKNF